VRNVQQRERGHSCSQQSRGQQPAATRASSEAAAFLSVILLIATSSIYRFILPSARWSRGGESISILRRFTPVSQSSAMSLPSKKRTRSPISREEVAAISAISAVSSRCGFSTLGALLGVRDRLQSLARARDLAEAATSALELHAQFIALRDEIAGIAKVVAAMSKGLETLRHSSAGALAALKEATRTLRRLSEEGQDDATTTEDEDDDSNEGEKQQKCNRHQGRRQRVRSFFAQGSTAAHHHLGHMKDFRRRLHAIASTEEAARFQVLLGRSSLAEIDRAHLRELEAASCALRAVLESGDFLRPQEGLAKAVRTTLILLSSSQSELFLQHDEHDGMKSSSCLEGRAHIDDRFDEDDHRCCCPSAAPSTTRVHVDSTLADGKDDPSILDEDWWCSDAQPR